MKSASRSLKVYGSVLLFFLASCQSILNGGTEQEIFNEISNEIMPNDPLLFHVYATVSGVGHEDRPIYATELSNEELFERASDLLAKSKECRAKQKRFNPDLESAIFYLEHSLERDSFVLHHYPIASDHGLHLDVFSHFSNRSISSKKEVESYLNDLSAIDQRFKEIIDQLELRRKNGFVAPSNILRAVRLTCDSVVLIPLEDNPVYLTYYQKLNSIGLLEPSKKDIYIESCKEILLESVIPAYVRLSNYLAQLEETSLNVVGVWRLPKSAEFYEHCLNWYTGLNLSVDSIYTVAKAELGMMGKENPKTSLSATEKSNFESNINYPVEAHMFRKTIPTKAHQLGFTLYSMMENETGYEENRLATAKLVVDIGIHQKRWLKEQAAQFLISNTTLDDGEAERMVNKSISNPGSIGANKLGQLVIKKLREENSNLSDAEFEIVITQHGPLPLSVLIKSISNNSNPELEN